MPAGTWAYKYRIVPNGEQCVGNCEGSDWEDVPEECGVGKCSSCSWSAFSVSCLTEATAAQRGPGALTAC